jgi:hypothetical protein
LTYTLPTNLTHYSNLYIWANDTTGFSSIAILILIFSIAFIGSQRYGARLESALLVSIMATTMVSGALMIMGALNGIVVSIMLVLLALTYIYTYHA